MHKQLYTLHHSNRIFTILVAFLLYSGNLFSQNLLLNPGFETASVGLPGGTPIPSFPNELDHWTATNTDGEFIFDLTKAHSGTGFLSVLQNAGANPVAPWLGISGFGGFDRAGQKVAIQPSTQYELKFWYKHGDGSRYGYTTGDLLLNIEQVMPTNVNITLQVIPTTSNWQLYTFNFTTGPTASEIIVLFSGIGSGNVDIWIDDTELNEGCTIQLDLGNDTTLCQGDNLVLNATDPNATSYLWQDNSTNPTFTVTQAGTYWVEVTAGSCSKIDSIVVNYTSLPVVNLGSDTTLCQGTSLVANAATPGATYLWQDNSTNPTFTITQAGTYWVEVSIGSCRSTDTLHVSYIPSPVINLGNDTTLCVGATMTADATTPGATYLWQDNSTNPTFTITQAGTYWAEVTVGNCSARDTLHVTYIPIPVINLGNDTTLCEGENLILNAATPGAGYLWQDNSTNSTFTVTQAGTYYVEVNVGNCRANDSIHIDYTPLPVLHLNDTTLCLGEILVLNVTIPNGIYHWQDSSTNPTFTITQAGTYWVEITTGNCSKTDTTHVIYEECEIIIEMPNVFSPNNDGFNDFFYPVIMQGISEASLIIYNRWGMQLFETTDVTTGWDGTFNGTGCTEGTYYWILPYTDVKQNQHTLSGFLTLVK